jgi:hypothetical protein
MEHYHQQYPDQKSRDALAKLALAGALRADPFIAVTLFRTTDYRYSPECVEEDFYELRLYGVLRSSPIGNARK